MKQTAIYQAQERLERAREAVRRMEAADSYKTFEQPWSDFLHAASSIYNKLEQGAKGCPKSEGWYGRKKHDRKKDQLLSYLHQARNTDHHGLGGTTLLQLSAKLDARTQGVKLSRGSDGKPVLQPTDESKPFEVLPPKVVLKAVKNVLYGDTFMPPKEHLGKQITSDPKELPSALDASRLGLAYLEGLFIEATQLPVHV
jgi:hypothetical protein